jgi:ABC-type transport system involved in multi-copper enzyme maturation permease subunit
VRVLRAELSKLARASVVVAALGCAGIAAVVTSFSLSHADVQYQVARDAYRQAAHPPSEAWFCRSEGVPVGPRCDRARTQELRAASGLLRETSAAYPVARAAQDPLGVGGVVAGLLASLVGVLVLGWLTVAHVAGEWSRGTIATVLAAEPRRVRFVLAKFVTAWLAGLGLLAFVWAAMLALEPFFRRVYDTPPAPAGFDVSSYAAGQVLRAAVVLAAIAAVSTAAGVLLRRPFAAAVALAGAVFVSLSATAWDSTSRFSPASWVEAWMRFRPVTQWVDHVWVDGWSAHPSQASGVLGLCLATVAALAIAGIRITRSDVE